MNYIGFIPELERQQQAPEDYIFGAESKPCIALIPEELRDQYLPIGEVQAGKQDTGACATITPTNLLESKCNYLYSNNLIKPENRKWLEDNNYAKDGKITFSDAFNSILSGSTREGNSMKAPLQSIHENGLIPKSLLPLEPWMMWEDYSDPKRITQEMRDLGQAFLQRFKLNYEKVYLKDFLTVLPKDFICVGVNAWPIPVNGEYPRYEGDFNHETLMYKRPAYTIFDSYVDSVDGDFVKKLTSDFNFYEYGYRVYISAELTVEDREIQVTIFDILLKNNLLSFFAEWWRKFTNAP